MTTSKLELKTLLALDPIHLDQQTLLETKISLTRSIPSNLDLKTQIIEKCRIITTILNLKFPKKKGPSTQQTQPKKYDIIILKCAQCSVDMYTGTTTRNPLTYCSKCRHSRDSDLVEIITSSETRIFTTKQLDDAEKALSEIEAPLRLDLHGVADLLPVTTLIKEKTVIVSYVGKLTCTRTNARTEMINRIKSGQIIAGVLIFLRGKKGTLEENMCHRSGAKAWVNTKLKPSESMHFVDDSEDHYESVKSLHLKGLKTTLLKSGELDELYKILDS